MHNLKRLSRRYWPLAVGGALLVSLALVLLRSGGPTADVGSIIDVDDAIEESISYCIDGLTQDVLPPQEEIDSTDWEKVEIAENLFFRLPPDLYASVEPLPVGGGETGVLWGNLSRYEYRADDLLGIFVLPPGEARTYFSPMGGRTGRVQLGNLIVDVRCSDPRNKKRLTCAVYSMPLPDGRTLVLERPGWNRDCAQSMLVDNAMVYEILRNVTVEP